MIFARGCLTIFVFLSGSLGLGVAFGEPGPLERGTAIRIPALAAGDGGESRLSGVINNEDPGPAQLSGPWGDPARDGEGLVVEVYENGFSSIIWFTYPDGTDPDSALQGWILGNGTLVDGVIQVNNAFRTSGLAFGEPFNADNYSIEPWGTFELRFNDQNTAVLNYSGTGGSGSFNLQKLIPLMGQGVASTLPASMSGAWIEVGSDGEGFFVQMLSATTAAVFWFTYDETGNQRWNLGVGQIVGSTIVIENSQVFTGTGFGNAFVAGDIEPETFATILMDFTDCDSGELHYLTAEGLVSRTFPLQRLTTLGGFPCSSLAEQDNSALKVMSNSYDPALTRFEYPDGSSFEIAGVYDAQSDESSFLGATAIAADGRSFQVYPEFELNRFHVMDQETGLQFQYEKGEGGNVSLSVFDPGAGVSSTVFLPDHVDEDPQQNGESARAELSLEEKSSNTESAKRSARTLKNFRVQVNDCNVAPTDLAFVDFVFGNRADSAMNPTVSGFNPNRVLVQPAYRYSDPAGSYYDTTVDDTEFELEPAVTDAICDKAPRDFDAFCDMQSSTSSACTELGRGIVIEPSLALSVASTCARVAETIEAACEISRDRATFCAAGNNTAFREIASQYPDVWARAVMPGAEGRYYFSGPLAVGPAPATTTMDPIAIPGQRVITGKTINSEYSWLVGNNTAVAGLPYELILHTQCFEPGEELLIEREPALGPQVYGCQVESFTDNLGIARYHCVNSGIETSRDWTTDLFVVTGPEEFSNYFSIDLADYRTQIASPEILGPDWLEFFATGMRAPNKCGQEDTYWEFEWTNPNRALGFILQIFHNGAEAFRKNIFEDDTEDSETVIAEVLVPMLIALEDRFNWIVQVTEVFDEGEFPLPSVYERFDVESCDALVRSLTVSKSGDGTGTVTSNPPGIACGNECSTGFTQNSQVSLQACPDEGSLFAQWTVNGLPGEEEALDSCSQLDVSLSQNTQVVAKFDQKPKITLNISIGGDGSGSVSNSINDLVCGDEPGETNCSTEITEGTDISIAASAAKDSTFAGWGGACASQGMDDFCNLTLDEDTSVSATFELSEKVYSGVFLATGYEYDPDNDGIACDWDISHSISQTATINGTEGVIEHSETISSSPAVGFPPECGSATTTDQFVIPLTITGASYTGLAVRENFHYNVSGTISDESVSVNLSVLLFDANPATESEVYGNGVLTRVP